MQYKNPQRVRGVLGRGTGLADLFLQARVGSDLALFQLLNRGLVADGAVDRAFVEQYCEGLSALTAHLESLDSEGLLDATGLSAPDVRAAQAMVAGAERIIVCWAMGLTQHKSAVATIREIVNLLLLRGSIGKAGAGVCPVRGHSNVQGDRTMGIYEHPPGWFLDALGTEFSFSPPREPGYDTVEAIRAMARGDVDTFFAMGGNFVAAAPDSEATAAALSRCRLSVQVSTKLNRSPRAHGGRGADPAVPGSHRARRHRRRGAVRHRRGLDERRPLVPGSLAPASADLLSEVAIVCRLATELLGESKPVDWSALEADYDRIRDHIEAVVPGFDRFNSEVRMAGRFTLPPPPRDSRTFPTTSGRAQLTVNPFDPIEIPPGRLLLQSVRSHDQYNTTIYGLDDRYRGVKGGRRVLFCDPSDLDELGLADGQIVDVVSEWSDDVERRAEGFRLVAYPVARSTCTAYFPEANVLVPLDSTADGSNQPTSKSVIVRLEPGTTR